MLESCARWAIRAGRGYPLVRLSPLPTVDVYLRYLHMRRILLLWSPILRIGRTFRSAYSRAWCLLLRMAAESAEFRENPPELYRRNAARNI